MPEYVIYALEKFTTDTRYAVWAETLEEAIASVKAGNEAYTQHEHTGYDDEWVGITAIYENTKGKALVIPEEERVE